MSLSKVRLIVVAVCLVAVSLGFDGNLGAANALGDGGGNQTQAAACGKCGDGQCVKQCGENERTCPADCGRTLTGTRPATSVSQR